MLLDNNRILISLGNNTDGLEVGMVVAWTLSANPSDNYLECNGQVVDSTKYPKLYQLMHNVPDYRGVFLRGLGSVTSNHYGTVTHTSSNLGELQGDAIRNIVGSLPVNDNVGFPTSTGAFYYGYSFSYGPKDENGTVGGIYYFDASRVVPVAVENRPINKAVRYFIKAK